jgi:hypothetical protein
MILEFEEKYKYPLGTKATLGPASLRVCTVIGYHDNYTNL